MKVIINVILFVLVIVSCDVFEPEEALKQEGTIHLQYDGIVSTQSGDKAAFTLVNDSTAGIQYFAYDATSPHYSTEALADTGWAYLNWNWCGTGAEYFELESGTSIQFYTSLPYESCTWRVMLSLAPMDLTSSRILRSDEITYSAP